MSRLLSKLDKYIRYDKWNSVALAFLQAIAGLVAGAFFQTIYEDWKTGGAATVSASQWIAFVLSAIVFLVLFIFHLWREKSFPGAIAEELKARHELEQKMRIIERRSLLDGFIENTIQQLNVNTCNIATDLDAQNRLCESTLSGGLSSVVASIRDFPHYLLDCSRNRFTIGALVENYFYIPPVGCTEDQLAQHQPPNTNSILAFRDDLGFREKIREQGDCIIFYTPDVSGPVLRIRETILESRNEKHLSLGEFSDQGITYTMVAAPIPAVCESPDEPVQGVLFLISEKLDDIPEDLDGILSIFGRIVANWISKYEDCVWNKFWQQQQAQEETSEQA